MSVVVERVKRSAVPGAERYTVTNITLDSAYATGGYAVSADDLGLSDIAFAMCQVVVPSSEDPVDGAALVSGKLVCTISGVEVANTATNDLSDAVVQVVAVGR